MVFYVVLCHFILLPDKYQTDGSDVIWPELASHDLLVIEGMHATPCAGPTADATAGLPDGTLFASQPQISMPVYVDFLRYCYCVVSSIPLNCPPTTTSIVHRIRWLLLLFHASVQLKISASRVYEPIAMDTPIEA